MALSVIELYQKAYRGLVDCLQNIYVNAEEGANSWLLLKARTTTYALEPKQYAWYYIPIQIRRTHSHHYVQVVLDQIESGISIALTTNPSDQCYKRGGIFFQNVISSFATNAIIIPKEEILSHQYSAITCICDMACATYVCHTLYDFREAMSVADPDVDLDCCHKCKEFRTAYGEELVLFPVNTEDLGPHDGGTDYDNYPTDDPYGAHCCCGHYDPKSEGCKHCPDKQKKHCPFVHGLPDDMYEKTIGGVEGVYQTGGFNMPIKICGIRLTAEFPVNPTSMELYQDGERFLRKELEPMDQGDSVGFLFDPAEVTPSNTPIMFKFPGMDHGSLTIKLTFKF